MARTAANLPEGTRITDYISLGVVAKTFPVDRIRRILAETGRTSKRQRDLPMHVVVYYVIAMALYMQVSCREVLRCLMEGIPWLVGREPTDVERGQGNRSRSTVAGEEESKIALYEEAFRRFISEQGL